MEDLKFDIIEYIGKLNDAIFVQVSINWKEVYYDAIFCYKEDVLIISVDEKLEKEWGCSVEEWIGYQQLLLSIMRKCVPYPEIIGRIDDFDENQYKIIYPNSNN
jgi:hypothetical protein